MTALPVAGRITLVGAGPGDADLLTIKAVRAIAQAEVIFVDDLVHPDVLLHASGQARIVHVGKRGGCASTPQAFIERRMELEARAGHQVVRLKGGDPFMFGRGGEELEHLRAAGLEVDVIPGITAGMAACASVGVPMTHRDHAPGCIFVTGHEKPGGQAVDWGALAATGMTLVVYMGVARAAHIQAALHAGGMSLEMPVVVVQSASLAQQRHVRTNLGALVATLAHEQIGSPAILVIGRVAQYALEALLPQAMDAPRAMLAT